MPWDVEFAATIPRDGRVNSEENNAVEQGSETDTTEKQRVRNVMERDGDKARDIEKLQASRRTQACHGVLTQMTREHKP